MSQHFEVIGVSAPGVEIDEVIKNEGIRCIELPMERKPSPIKDILSIIRMYILIKKEKPTIVHTHTPKAGMVGMIASFFAKVPVRLHTVAGLPLMESKGLKFLIYKFIEKITYLCANQVYPNSKKLAEYIVNEKIAHESKVKVIGNGSTNGIDTNYFMPKYFEDQSLIIREKLNIKTNDFIFLYIGRLVKDKGVNEMLSAFEQVLLKRKNIKLLLVGDYEEERDPISVKSKDTIAKNENIIMIGFQSDVRPYLSIANCFVFPSYREGFPNVVLQAGAMEKCSIVTDINGSNEIVIHNETGIIVPPKDSKALYLAMEAIISDETIDCYAMGKKARERIVCLYEQQKIWELILKEYYNCIRNV
ncbi:MAG TPA: glycosyltransferase family 1 protein [Bacteroidales bacterium]|nr:glycosyltransferase family 1 protein [Bacteroidales bacterium]